MLQLIYTGDSILITKAWTIGTCCNSIYPSRSKYLSNESDSVDIGLRSIQSNRKRRQTTSKIYPLF